MTKQEAKLWDSVAISRQSIELHTREMNETLLQLAALTSPYKAGDKIKTNQGLGIYGLQVDAVVGPKDPSPTNRWALSTFAFSKAGEITRRSVGIEEQDLAKGLVIIQL